MTEGSSWGQEKVGFGPSINIRKWWQIGSSEAPQGRFISLFSLTCLSTPFLLEFDLGSWCSFPTASDSAEALLSQQLRL